MAAPSNIFQVNDRNQDATLFVGELEGGVTEGLLWELFLQAGPVGTPARRLLRKHSRRLCLFLAVNVYIPKDKVSNIHTGFARSREIGGVVLLR
jgi:splicing factor 3B subunit 4